MAVHGEADVVVADGDGVSREVDEVLAAAVVLGEGPGGGLENGVLVQEAVQDTASVAVVPVVSDVLFEKEEEFLAV